MKLAFDPFLDNEAIL